MRYHEWQNLLPIAVTAGFAYSLYALFSPDAFYVLGAFLGIAGLVFWWRGKLDLGDAFAMFPRAQRLVTSGIYRRFRHPIYIGLSLLLFGWAAMAHSSKLLSVAIVVTAIDISRAQLENEVLRKRFGKRYAAYERQVWF